MLTKVQSILMYTISNDETRDEFVHQLEQRYGERLILLDQSTYGMPIIAVSPIAEVKAINAICRNIVQNNHYFSTADTIYYCYSAAMRDIRHPHSDYDKIFIEDILEGVQRRRLQLFQ